MKARSENDKENKSDRIRPGPPEDLEKKLEYTFGNAGILEEALTHRSLLNEIDATHRRDNERLEFLGDSVLGFLITDWIMSLFPDEQEGELTRIRSALVKEKRLGEVSRKLDLGHYLHLGKGEEQMGGRRKLSVLGNAFEAIVGAIYLDGGIGEAQAFVRRQFQPFLEKTKGEHRILADPKTQLQELLLALLRSPPVYKVVEESGPDHEKTFVMQLQVMNLVLATGKGRSKKEAEQEAAEHFLKELEKNPFGML